MELYALNQYDMEDLVALVAANNFLKNDEIVKIVPEHPVRMRVERALKAVLTANSEKVWETGEGLGNGRRFW